MRSMLAVLVLAAVTAACGSDAHVASAPTPTANPVATGTLQVKISGGGSLAPSGFTVTVDGTTTQTAQNDGMIVFSNLSAGSHAVALSGLAENCRAEGGNPRTVDIPANGTATVEFELVCSVVAPTEPR